MNLNYSFKDQGFVEINILWKGNCVNLVNVYAHCNVLARRNLKKRLVERRNKQGREEWCLRGDFNEISSREERMGEDSYHNV